jgi:hypothetical protein
MNVNNTERTNFIPYNAIGEKRFLSYSVCHSSPSAVVLTSDLMPNNVAVYTTLEFIT